MRDYDLYPLDWTSKAMKTYDEFLAKFLACADIDDLDRLWMEMRDGEYIWRAIC